MMKEIEQLFCQWDCGTFFRRFCAIPIETIEMLTGASRHRYNNNNNKKVCKEFLCSMITSMICNIDRECNIGFMVTFEQKATTKNLYQLGTLYTMTFSD